MAKKKRAKKPVKVESLKHKDKRKNIPTEELRDFVAEDEKKPKTVLYPRDPSLDPQLVWKGKDEQDSKDLAVSALPIYIQEKIKPHAIIENIQAEARRTAPRKQGEFQTEMFSDFNGISFEQMVDFYQYDQNWSNRMILGDSLYVMTSLAEKESLKGKVQMIFIDPPYGIKFNSNWQVSTRKREVKDGRSTDVTRQPEQITAFRDTWKLGIHSYLAYLRDRVVVSRELLTETGTIFIQIGDENVHLVRCLLDEVFGAENRIATIAFVKTSSSTRDYLPNTFDYILVYAKNRDVVKIRPLFLEKLPGEKGGTGYTRIELNSGLRRTMTVEEKRNKSDIPKGSRIYCLDNLTSQSIGREKGEGAACWFNVPINGKNYRPSLKGRWKTNEDGMRNLVFAYRVEGAGNTLGYIRYIEDFPVYPISDFWDDVMASFMADKVYVVQTMSKVIERCILLSTDPGDLILDPTCGSGSTAFVAEEWGRRWITIDTSRVSIALARTRLMSGRFSYYHLADSPEGLEKESEITGKLPPNIKTNQDIRKGFVYKRVPHIMLSSIAKNGEIETIHKKWQPKQDAAREKLNKALKEKWEEWEAPHEAGEDWSKDAKKLHAEFWKLRRERQKEIDESIARNSDQEILYDQPYEDKKRVRVTGPFTVESLSPHRVLSTDEELPRSERDEETEAAGGQFENMILENLKTAGVKSTTKGEGIKFDRIEPYAGQWIQAEGEYTDKSGKSKRVAICIGPEHGTVGPTLIKEAAKEAVQGIGFEILVICGFAFDPHVSEEATRYGKLKVMIARMNPDLAMGDELLKKTGSGNLFMVFGEPDIDIKKKNGKMTIEVKGVDIYDPTTGEIRSNSTDDIACWFIDSNYNGESFFVRHAYFCGGDKPYDKLKRALRAEVNEEAWESLYSTVSRPFERPETGKIAVKIINHYGDEVLKVYDLK